MPVESNTVSENGWSFGPIVLIEEQVLWVPEPRLLRNTLDRAKAQYTPASRSNVEKNMRKLVVLTFLTLDGVMQAPGGPEEDPSGVFKWGGWSAGYWDDTLGKVMGDQMGHPYDLLLGRKTYEIFAAHWPHSTDPGADELNSARKHVASTTLRSVTWNNSTLIKGDLPAYVANLKQQSGPEIQVHGSGQLIQTLLQHDLVDEFHLLIFPIVLGSGK